MTYSDKLKDPRWQKMRLLVFDRDDWKCQCCGDTENTLHCHHKKYISGKDPWDIDTDNLVTLCENCHKRVTNIPKEGGDLAFQRWASREVFKYLLIVMNHCTRPDDEIVKAYEKLYKMDKDISIEVKLVVTGNKV